MMPGVHISAAPGFNGWTRLAREGTWKTYVPAEVREMQAAIRADRADCLSCMEGTPVSHNTGSVHTDQNGRSVGITYHCRSWSRWFNPATRQMEGNAHCTCDGCF